MRCVAIAATPIWATCLMTVRRPPACAIASIPLRSVSSSLWDEQPARKTTSSVTYERGLAGDAKPNSILPDPCIGEPSMPRKSFSAFNSSLFENSSHHRAVAIQAHRDILVDNLVGTYGAGFDALQELSLVRK